MVLAHPHELLNFAKKKFSEVGRRDTVASTLPSARTYRDAETFKKLDTMGYYVADDEAARIVNEYVREKQGWKIDFYSGDVPPPAVMST